MEHLTLENLTNCLDEYLRKMEIIDKDSAIDLFLYLDYAISTKDIALIKFVNSRIMGYLIGY